MEKVFKVDTVVKALRKLDFTTEEILLYLFGIKNYCRVSEPEKKKILEFAKKYVGEHDELNHYISPDEDGWLGINLLMRASFFYGDWLGLALVRLLLENGADVNQEDAFGCPPIIYACMAANIDNIKELWVAGANLLDKRSFESEAFDYVGYEVGGSRRRVEKARDLVRKLMILECHERGEHFAFFESARKLNIQGEVVLIGREDEYLFYEIGELVSDVLAKPLVSPLFRLFKGQISEKQARELLNQKAEIIIESLKYKWLNHRMVKAVSAAFAE
jgi:hypothetical protein